MTKQMQITLKIQRFNPETDKAPHYENYQVDMEPADRVLDALLKVKWFQDGTLTLRKSCAHGVCGSDAMRINGKNALACKTLVQDCGKTITVEPMKSFKVVKDLVVEMKAFFDKYKSVKPFLINDDTPPEKERRQSPAELAKFEDSTKCILCGACTTSCPSFWANPNYIGPAAIVAAHRFIFDSRDQGADERLAVMNEADGVWRCRTIFNCVEACPRGIDVTKAIADVKKAILRGAP